MDIQQFGQHVERAWQTYADALLRDRPITLVSREWWVYLVCRYCGGEALFVDGRMASFFERHARCGGGGAS